MKNPAEAGFFICLAESQGFEPWVPLRVQRISNPSRSTTPATLQVGAHDSSFVAAGGSSDAGYAVNFSAIYQPQRPAGSSRSGAAKMHYTPRQLRRTSVKRPEAQALSSRARWQLILPSQPRHWERA